MGEFDTLKDDAEKYARQHPEQVKEGEQAAEKELGMEQGNAPQDKGGQTPGSGDHDQDSAGQ